MNVNNIFLTGFSLDLNGLSCYEDFERSLDAIELFIDTVPDYNHIEICRDFFQQDLGGESFDDILYEISGYSDPSYTEMLKELEHVLKSNRGYQESSVILALADTGASYNDEFIGLYSQKKSVPNVKYEILVDSSEALFTLNCNNLANFPIDERSFGARAKLIFDGICFHQDFENTLLTVRNGDFKVYSNEFVRTFRALHNAFPLLSNQGHFKPDLEIIKNETAKVGRTMDCTVQGKNKQDLKGDFVIVDSDGNRHIKKDLNCEFHLKINFDNTGKKLDRKFYCRAYFGLPLINGKKYIALLHVGKHE